MFREQNSNFNCGMLSALHIFEVCIIKHNPTLYIILIALYASSYLDLLYIIKLMQLTELDIKIVHHVSVFRVSQLTLTHFLAS